MGIQIKVGVARFVAAGILSCISGLSFGERYALVVGISDYPLVKDAKGRPIKENGKNVDLDLPGPINDVRAWADLLEKKYNFKKANIKRLVNGQASADGFLKAVRWLFTTASEGDEVVLIYSGHGSQIPDPKEEDGIEEVLVMADLKLVPGDFFAEFRAAFASKKVAASLIFDSCFSGGMSKGLGDLDGHEVTLRTRAVRMGIFNSSRKVTRSFLPKPKAGMPESSFAFVSAGSEGEPTLDVSFKDKKMPARGIFSYFFTALLSSQPGIPLFDAVREITRALARGSFKQRPSLDLNSPSRGDQPLLIGK